MTDQLVTRSDKRLDLVSSASLTDAMGRRYSHKAHILDLVSPTPDRKLFGAALTMQFLPVRADLNDPDQNNFARHFYLATQGASPVDKVLIISSAGHRDTSVAGGTKLSRLQNLNMAGVLTDGRLRDFHELSDYDFVTYCSGRTTRWGGDSVMPWAIQSAVEIAGVTVIPGDYVYGDVAGVVVIPAESVQWVLDEAVKIEKADQAALEQIRNEDPDTVRKSGSKEQ
jgi:regulator of RNase E activity RraA